MSKTEVKNGRLIWEAVRNLMEQYYDADGGWLTVGEVAQEAGVSKPTAKKYLDLAVDMNHCNRFRPRGKGPVFYRPVMG